MATVQGKETSDHVGYHNAMLLELLRQPSKMIMLAKTPKPQGAALSPAPVTAHATKTMPPFKLPLHGEELKLPDCRETAGKYL